MSTNKATSPLRGSSIKRLVAATTYLIFIVACRGAENHPPPTKSASPRKAPSSQPPLKEVPPPPQRACTKDADCAVARIEVTGEHACCDACGTTPGNMAWHVQLQRYCGSHVPKSCPPLACPSGPTHAACNAGVCEATGSSFVPVEDRCLPAIVCDTWAGCAHISGNAQDGYHVLTSHHVARGEPASIDSPCTKGERCKAARLSPPEAQCAPQTVPPLIRVPSYVCTMEAGKCVSKPR